MTAQSDNSAGSRLGAVPPGKTLRGGKRMIQLAREAEADRKALADQLIASLGRPATAIDIVATEALSAAIIRGRRLRARGRDDADQMRLVAQLLRTANMKPQPPAAPKKVDPQEALLQYLNAGSST